MNLEEIETYLKERFNDVKSLVSDETIKDLQPTDSRFCFSGVMGSYTIDVFVFTLSNRCCIREETAIYNRAVRISGMGEQLFSYF